MELEFDKEIDALLRQSARSGEAVVVKDPHLDADEISAFAENALPDRLKQRYTAHLAECTRCRKILSNLILLNSEAETMAASSGVSEAAAKPAIPWYRKIFLFPQLAYTMGALVILFGGFLVFLVLENTGLRNAEISSSSAPANKATGPKSDVYSTANTNASYNSMPAANAPTSMPAGAANTASNSANSSTLSNPPVAAATPTGEDEKLNQAAPLPTNAAERPRDDEQRELDKDVVKKQPDSKTGETSKEKKLEEKTSANETRSKNEPLPSTEQAPKPTAGALSSADIAKAEKRKTDQQTLSRQVGGKTFRNVGGIWFDSEYTTQKQISVRRGTGEYQKLDSGVRSIADQLSGTVVVLWKKKAYRIQ